MGFSVAVARARRGRGLSLLEGVVVLALGALALTVIVFLIVFATNSNKTNETALAITAIRQTVDSMYKGQSNYDGLSPNLLARSRQLPSSMVRGSDESASIVSPFGGPIGVIPTAGGQRYMVIVGGLPRDACIHLATSDMSTEAVGVYVAGGEAPVFGIERVLTPDEAMEACGDGNGSMVAFGDEVYQSSLIAWSFR